jgi:hypothetical protein
MWRCCWSLRHLSLLLLLFTAASGVGAAGSSEMPVGKQKPLHSLGTRDLDLRNWRKWVGAGGGIKENWKDPVQSRTRPTKSFYCQKRFMGFSNGESFCRDEYIWMLVLETVRLWMNLREAESYLSRLPRAKSLINPICHDLCSQLRF